MKREEEDHRTPPWNVVKRNKTRFIRKFDVWRGIRREVDLGCLKLYKNGSNSIFILNTHRRGNRIVIKFYEKLTVYKP